MTLIDSNNSFNEEVIKQRDREWTIKTAFEKAEKSERVADFSIGFSVFTLIFILVVELVIAHKK